MKKAFTLIEVLIVVLVLGILATLAIPQISMAIQRSRLAEAWVNLTAIKRGEDIYYMEHSTYTTSMSDLDIELEDTDNFNYEILPDETGYKAVATGYGTKYIGLEAWVKPDGTADSTY